jgi:hypothetical protein
MTDERKAKPSASAAERWVNCPGYFLPSLQVENPSNEDADEGTRLHKAVETGDMAGLDDEQATAVREAQEATERLVGDIFWSDGFSEMREQRLWLDESFSTRIDYAAIGDTGALLVDYKFGRGDVTEAAGNLQLMAQAAILHATMGVNYCHVAIVQPRSYPTVSLAVYERGQLRYAAVMLSEAAKRAMLPNQPRKAGRWCKYCPVAATCAEHRGYALAVQSFDLADPSRLAMVLDRLPEIEAAVKYAKEQAVELLLDDENALPGYRLHEGKISLTAFEVTVRKATGLAGKKLKDAIENLTGGIVDTKEVISNRRNITDEDALCERLSMLGVSSRDLRKMRVKVEANKL